MIDTKLDQRPARRFDFSRIPATLLHPRQAFAEMAATRDRKKKRAKQKKAAPK
jgi:hypothetical protein